MAQLLRNGGGIFCTFKKPYRGKQKVERQVKSKLTHVSDKLPNHAAAYIGKNRRFDSYNLHGRSNFLLRFVSSCFEHFVFYLVFQQIRRKLQNLVWRSDTVSRHIPIFPYAWLIFVYFGIILLFGQFGSLL